MLKILTVTAAAVLCVGVSGRPQHGGGGGGGGYGKQPEGYFQYVNVPAHKEYEFGWNRGNPHHYISRFEQAKDHRFRTRVKWADKHGGYGEHYWEYNHAPKYKEHDSYKEPEPYHAPAPTYHAPEPSYHAPEPSYHAPEPSYHDPKPSYKHPEPIYDAFEPTYGPPQPHGYPSDNVPVIAEPSDVQGIRGEVFKSK
ncbi:uncharacterized protein LOC135094396 [Scylla paramamosain]|uniref:uncharacterized protein LOC135094396 n=1 Tax=Scylla paramamosain TaxID=85552 RepID=UPI0030830515